MLTYTALAARHRALFSRTLVLTALLVVAAAGSVFSVRSARADAPVAPSIEGVPGEAHAVANLIAAQSVGNAALGVSFMQVLWGGGTKDNPPKLNSAVQRASANRHGTVPAQRKTTSAK